MAESEQSSYPTPFQQKMLWKALTGISLCVLGALVVGAIYLLGRILSYLQPVLVPLAVAGIIAYLLDPIVTKMMKKGMSRLKSVLLVFGSFFVVLGVMVMIIIPPLAEQVSDEQKRQEIGNNISQYINTLGKTPWIKPAVDWALTEYAPEEVAAEDGATTVAKADVVRAKKFSDTQLAHYIESNAGKIFATVRNFITSSTSTIFGLMGYVIGLAMVPIYLYYFLKESASIKQNWHHYVPLKASKLKTEVVSVLSEINGYLISFFRGQVLVALIDGLLVGVALWVFRLPYGVLIGLCLGVLGVIPFIGNLLCLVPACFIAYVHFMIPENQVDHFWLLGNNPWAYVAAVAAIFIIVQQINSLVTAPKIVGDSVGLHPMTVIFSMLFWSLILGGFLGTLLAVPMTAAVKVLFRRYIWEKRIQDKIDTAKDSESRGNGDNVDEAVLAEADFSENPQGA